MTRDAAEILGVGKQLGSIAVGKQSRYRGFAGDPLDPSVPARLVVSKGKVLYQADVAPVAVAPQRRQRKRWLLSGVCRNSMHSRLDVCASKTASHNQAWCWSRTAKCRNRPDDSLERRHSDVPISAAVLTAGCVVGHKPARHGQRP